MRGPVNTMCRVGLCGVKQLLHESFKIYSMALLLQSKLFFPCSVPYNNRMLMAVRTKHNVRLVAFENVIDALDAMDTVRRRDLHHVVGPKLMYCVRRLEDESDNDVWEASANDIARYGMNEFVLDICDFEKDTAIIHVNNTFSIVLENLDSSLVMENLKKSWGK